MRSARHRRVIWNKHSLVSSSLASKSRAYSWSSVSARSLGGVATPMGPGVEVFIVMAFN